MNDSSVKREFGTKTQMLKAGATAPLEAPVDGMAHS